jgi:NhaP-type Na+/H+ or K+/H+ antiporter
VCSSDLNGSDVNEIVSGGLRLPLPIWGYVSFSWIGVCSLGLIVGFLTGRFIKKTKRLLQKTDNIIIKAIILLLYMHIYQFVIDFYCMKIYNIPILLIMILYLYNFKLKSTKSSASMRS